MKPDETTTPHPDAVPGPPSPVAAAPVDSSAEDALGASSEENATHETTEATDATEDASSEAPAPRRNDRGPRSSRNLPRLRGMTLREMTDLLAEGGFPAFRAKQLHHWIYRRGAETLDEMGNLPKALREWLPLHSVLGGVEVARVTGERTKTRKILFRLSDGRFIESVVMRDEGKGRTSICVSSQVGCAVGCTFCLTGYGGYERQLSPDEIVGQVLAARRHAMEPDEPLHGLVFMGMGEPMLNLDAVVKAVRLLSDPEGVALSARRITVSTSGIAPGIAAFGAARTGASLAVSLNATTDAVREKIMPIDRKYPIAELIRAMKDFPLKPRERVTVEYVLLRGVNDDPEDARRLTRLLRPLRCKVNLIMFNPHELLDFEPVPPSTLDDFTRTLVEAGYTVSVRWSKGREIEAACGQLAAHYFEKRAVAGV